MKAPVWFLIARIDLVGGSSSDHRAELVNMFITRVSDWWLIGADSANWGWGMWDTANQYVGEGLAGGMATFVCFLGLIALAFRRVGRARKAVAGDPSRLVFAACHDFRGRRADSRTGAHFPRGAGPDDGRAHGKTCWDHARPKQR